MRKLTAIILLAAFAACFLLFGGGSLAGAVALPVAADFPEMDFEAAARAREQAGLAVRCSLAEGFYAGDVTLELEADEADAAIHYTLDGADPTADSPLYTGPLGLEAEAETVCLALKARAFGPNGAAGAITARSYFVGGGVAGRFSTLVFSITTDAANLYDHQTGIMVEGALREEYLAGLEPGATAEWHHPANYNERGRQWERPANVSVFTAGGECVVSQAVGLRLAGGGSRQFEQKSLRLVAREEYQPGAGKFRYDFFPRQADDLYGAPITAYDSLVLRNGGNDRYFAQLRNEVGCQLAADAGYAAVSPSAAAAVYLNGEYYGFAWLQESLNEQALEDIYDAPDQAFEFADLAEANPRADGTVLERRQPPALDLGEAEQYALYQSLVDVEDLLFYYAFQIYTGNIDWPGNNVKLWRYTGEAGAAHPALDGRWRHVLYDLDTIAGFDLDTIAGFDDVLTWDAPTLEDLMGAGDEYRQSPLLGALLARPELAAEFAARMCELADQHLTEARARQAMEGLWKQAEAELLYALENGVEPGWVGAERISSSQKALVDFFARRAEYALPAVAAWFGYSGEMYTVEAEGPALIGTNGSGRGSYFVECPVTLAPNPAKGEVFSHWELNGEKLYEPELKVSIADLRGGAVRVRCVVQAEVPAVSIASAVVRADQNGCTLQNNTAGRLSLAGWHLTDDPNQPEKWAFPAVSIAPEGSLELVGSQRQSTEVLLKMALGFNIASGETLLLTNAEGQVVDYYGVP